MSCPYCFSRSAMRCERSSSKTSKSGMCSVASRLPGALSLVKPVIQQGLWPVVAKVDRDGSPGGGRLSAQVGQRFGLELDDLGLIDLVDDGPGRPRQPVRARVEPGGQDH